MSNTMKLNFLLPMVLVAGALVCSCNSKEQGTHQSYFGICSFEFTDLPTVWTDSVYMTDRFYGAEGVTFSGYNPASTVSPTQNGFILSARHDPTLESGHLAKDLATVEKFDYKNQVFVVYQDTPGVQPRHVVTFDYQSIGTCVLNGFFVNNTTRVATLAAYGQDGIPAFAPGDWLKLTVTGYVGTTPTGKTQEVMLADYTGSELQLIKEWTAVETKDFGAFQYLDFAITSNRTDVPLQACIDDLVTNIEIEY